MPSLSPDELQDAKRRKAEERRLQEEHDRAAEKEEAERWRAHQEQEDERREHEQGLLDRYTQLENYVGGVYDEVTKFSTKWPNHPVSPMMVTRANRAISSARELLVDENDEFFDEIEELIPAGDSVPAQDVTLTLRTVKDALARMKGRHSRAWLELR